jgi:hypothetical protein
MDGIYHTCYNIASDSQAVYWCPYMIQIFLPSGVDQCEYVSRSVLYYSFLLLLSRFDGHAHAHAYIMV